MAMYYQTTTSSVTGASFTIGTEATNVINVAVKLNVQGGCFAYLSDNADGSTLAGTAPSGGVAIGTDGLLIESVTNKAWNVISESDGDFDIDITEAGADTWYLVLVLSDGTLAISGAITFA